MARGRDDDGSSDGVRVHARLRVVIQSHQSPVSDHASHALQPFEISMDNKVFYRSRIEQDDVRHGKHFGQERGSEQRGVLDDDKCSFVLVRNAKLPEERICRFADDLRKVQINNRG